MKSTLTTALALLSLHLVSGIPLIDPSIVFANTGDNTTNHVEIQPRQKIISNNDADTTKHFEIVPREESPNHWEIPEIVPREQKPTENPIDGGDGTIPSGAVNEGGVKEISKMPYKVEDEIAEEITKVPCGDKKCAGPIQPANGEISMMPFEVENWVTLVPFDATPSPEGPWVGGQGTAPPGALNDESSSSFMRGARFLLRAFGF